MKNNTIQSLAERAKSINPDTFQYLRFEPNQPQGIELVAWFANREELGPYESTKNPLIQNEQGLIGVNITDWMTPDKASFSGIEAQLETIILKFAILSGDIVGDGQETWQEHAMQSAGHLRYLAELMEQAAKGNSEPFMSFPSINETMVIKVTD